MRNSNNQRVHKLVLVRIKFLEFASTGFLLACSLSWVLYAWWVMGVCPGMVVVHVVLASGGAWYVGWIVRHAFPSCLTSVRWLISVVLLFPFIICIFLISLVISVMCCCSCLCSFFVLEVVRDHLVVLGLECLG